MGWTESIGDSTLIVLVELRLMQTRAPVDRDDPACTIPREDELLECIRRLDETSEEHYRFSAHSQV